MGVETLSFKSWCSRASAHIQFKADRPAVERELLEHMEDHFEALLNEGMPAREAERRMLAAMGDADETGKALAAVHKPYFGWLYTALKWAVALAAVLLFMTSCTSGFTFDSYGFSEPFEGLATESDENYQREITYIYPDAKANCNGYALSLPIATHRTGTWVDEDGITQTYTSVYFVLEAMHPLPWAGYPNGLRECLYAVDSLGNLYPNRSQKDSLPDETGREVCGNAIGRTMLRYRYQMWIAGLDASAEWVELRYERLGCAFALRIDLTEGGAKA